MSKWKKHKLTLPPVALRFIHPELARRQGEISNMWDESLIKAYPDWFEEIPTEPVVLSAEEWVDRQPFRSIEDEDGTVKLFRSKRLFTFDQMVHACETFKQNGRLERDLELRGLVEAIHKYAGDLHPVDFMGIVLKEYYDLKPLNKESV